MYPYNYTIHIIRTPFRLFSSVVIEEKEKPVLKVKVKAILYKRPNI